MALEGIPNVTPMMRNFVAQVRLYIRDYPELNRIVRGEESSDRQIAWATLDALDNFNGTPHFTSMTLDDLLQRHQAHLMTRLTVVALLESVALLQARNHINYSNGAINVGVNDKGPLLLQYIQYYRSYTEQLKQRVKVAFNIEGILGPSMSGVHSEIWAVNGTYCSY
jgi:hypothetical protein